MYNAHATIYKKKEKMEHPRVSNISVKSRRKHSKQRKRRPTDVDNTATGSTNPKVHDSEGSRESLNKHNGSMASVS